MGRKHRNPQGQWFFAESLRTGEWDMFRAERDYCPKAGQAVPPSLVEASGENGDWVVRLIPPRQSQRLLKMLGAMDSFAEAQPGGFSCGSWLVIRDLVRRCIKADRSTQLPAGKVTVDFTSQLPAGIVVLLLSATSRPALPVPTG